MADLSISLTVPDAQLSKVSAALNWRWGQIDDGAGGTRDSTLAELKRCNVRIVQDIVDKYEDANHQATRPVRSDLGIT